MTEPDETMTRIGQGIELGQRGQRNDARQLFTKLWERPQLASPVRSPVSIPHYTSTSARSTASSETGKLPADT